VSAALGRSRFVRDLLAQRHVIEALILRDIAERIGHGRIGIFFIFAEPLVLGAAITAINSVLHAGEFAEIMMFYSVGYLCFYMLRNILNRAGMVISVTQNLLYHSRVTLLSSFIPRHIVEFLISITVMTVFVGAALYFGARVPDSPIKMISGFLLVMLLTQGMAFLLASLVHEYPSIERGAHIVSYIFLPMSGIFFILDNLPPPIRDILVWFPWALAIDLLHDGMAGERYKYHWDIPYILVCIGGLHVLGLSALRRVRDTLALD
jgi:capsular polysaccharide transport system permease protein